MLNLALNACFEKFFSLNRISIKKYFRCAIFLTNRLTNKIIFRLNIFLPNRLSKRISNWLSKKSYSLIGCKIKISVGLFFVGSIGANFYKSFMHFFVQHDERQNIYFDCIVFLPSKHATKRKNHCEKKYKKIVHLSRLNACF